MDERQAFLAALEEAPLDNFRRCVFADWLDERGEVEEATRQRAWLGAYEYLRRYYAPYGEGPETVHFNEVMTVIAYWHDSIVKGGGICFGTDAALERLYEEENRAEFFRNLEIVTGTQIAPETRARTGFRCAC